VIFAESLQAPRAVPRAALAAAAVVACIGAFGLTPRAAVAAFLLAVMAVLAAIDIERRVLPNRIVVPAAAAVLAAQLVLFPEHATAWILGALLAALVVLVAHLAYPAGMGMGDVKVALLLGAALGAAVAVALVVAVAAAALVAVFVLARNGRNSTLPFGPFLAIGTAVAVFAGEPLLHAYLATL
jgi:leader peptidase (prepilin peptidase) / N-methyltransferase